MHGHPRSAGLTAATAVLAGTLLLAAVELPYVMDAPNPTLPDLLASAALLGSAVWLTSSGRARLGAVLCLAGAAWTLVGLAALLPSAVETPVARLALLPHALVAAAVIALLPLPSRTRRVLTVLAVVIAAVAGAGYRIPALAGLGLTLSAALFFTPRRLNRWVPSATALAFAVGLVALDPTLWGSLLTPQATATSVAVMLAAISLAVVLLVSEARLDWAFDSDAGEASSLGTWLATLVGVNALDVAFPAGLGRVDLAGVPMDADPDAGVLRDPSGAVVAFLSPPPSIEPSLDAPLARMLVVLGAVAELRSKQRVQADEIARSRARLLVAADDESRALERQLEHTVMGHLDAVTRLLRGVEHAPALDARLRAVRSEVRRHARGLDPLTGRTLASAVCALGDSDRVRVDLGALDSLPEHVARTAWFVAAEGVANARKHAPESRIRINARPHADALHITVADDGPGGADPSGSGLRGLADRVAAIGGRLSITSSPSGTTVAAELPHTGFPASGPRAFADSRNSGRS